MTFKEVEYFFKNLHFLFCTTFSTIHSRTASYNRLLLLLTSNKYLAKTTSDIIHSSAQSPSSFIKLVPVHEANLKTQNRTSGFGIHIAFDWDNHLKM